MVVAFHVVRDITSPAEAIQIFQPQKEAHKEAVLKTQNYHIFSKALWAFGFGLTYFISIFALCCAQLPVRTDTCHFTARLRIH